MKKSELIQLVENIITEVLDFQKIREKLLDVCDGKPFNFNSSIEEYTEYQLTDVLGIDKNDLIAYFKKLEQISTKLADFSDLKNKTNKPYIVTYKNSKYYADPQGYDYPRYMFKFSN